MGKDTMPKREKVTKGRDSNEESRSQLELEAIEDPQMVDKLVEVSLDGEIEGRKLTRKKK